MTATKSKLRQRIEREIVITVHAEQDYATVRGNAMASGDDDADKEYEDSIIERLANGDVWAWASVEVRGEWKGLESSDYLECCTYEDEQDFRTNSVYFNDMVSQVIDKIEQQAEDIRK